MKTILALALATSAVLSAGAVSAQPMHHDHMMMKHHRHQVRSCTMMHHHRVCRMVWR